MGLELSPIFFGCWSRISAIKWGTCDNTCICKCEGYFTKSKVSPYIFANLGYGFGDEKGFYGAGGLGVDFTIASTLGIYINLGYQSLGIADNIQSNGIYGPSNMGAFLIQTGFRF